MNRWPTKPLGELGEFRGGGTPSRKVPEYFQGDIPWITGADVTDVYVSKAREFITKEAIENSATNLLPAKTLLVVTRTGVGKIGIAATPLCISQDLTGIICNDGVLPEYLAHYLLAGASMLTSAVQGSTILGITREYLKKVPIPVPPLAEQERIVKLLDEADELRKLRAQADRRTTALIPALFHEMFGNPATNPFGWIVETVGNLFDQARDGAKCGPFGSALKKHEYVEAGIPVWGIPNVLPNKFIEAGSLFVSPSKFGELRAYAVEPGDLLISRAGTVGRICVATPTSKASIVGTNLIRLVLDQNKVVPAFFSALLTYFAKDVGRLRANIDEGAYSFMNTTVLKALRICVPPLKRQKEFAQRVTEIRELEASQTTSRTRLDALFQSILHRAFDGNL